MTEMLESEKRLGMGKNPERQKRQDKGVHSSGVTQTSSWAARRASKGREERETRY